MLSPRPAHTQSVAEGTLPAHTGHEDMVVQKFGGTSVADPAAIRRLIEIVRAARTRDGRGPAVVVSAMSGVTDLLLAIASGAGTASGTKDALTRIEQLRERHLASARDVA